MLLPFEFDTFYQNPERITSPDKRQKCREAIGLDPKFHTWCKKHFKIDVPSTTDISCSVTNGCRIVMTASYIIILKSIHETTGWGGRDKMRYEINQPYYWLPSHMIDLFFSNLVIDEFK